MKRTKKIKKLSSINSFRPYKKREELKINIPITSTTESNFDTTVHRR